MQIRIYTPGFKISLMLVVGLIIRVADFKYALVYEIFIAGCILVALQTYKVVLEDKTIVIHKLFRKEKRIDGNLIQKIEIVAIRSGRLPSYRLRIYTEDKIHEISITWFGVDGLMKGIINFSSSNGISVEAEVC